MDKREAILNAALNLIDKQGIHNAPMSKIAKEAGVAAGSLYNYFENKQALVDGLYTDIKHKMINCFKTRIEQEQLLEDKIFMCFKSLFDFYNENPVEGKFLAQYSFSTYVSKELVDKNFEIFDEYTILLKEAISKGVLKDVPIDTILCIVIGTVKETHHHIVNNQLTINDEMVEQIYSIVISGLKA